MAAALSDRISQLLLRVSELLEQLPVGPRFFKRIQIGALDIFNESYLKCFTIAEFTDENRQFMKSRPLRGAPPAFTGNDFIFAVGALADYNRLQQPLLSNGFRQVLKFFFPELLARVVGVGMEQLYGKVAQAP